MSNLSGVFAIQEERMRQQVIEGWDSQHDDQHSVGELADAAASYAHFASMQEFWRESTLNKTVPNFWPWNSSWWKPNDDPIKNLVKAGALIAAEIDRIQRKRESENTD